MGKAAICLQLHSVNTLLHVLSDSAGLLQCARVHCLGAGGNDVYVVLHMCNHLRDRQGRYPIVYR